jgi:hypothetical protein
MSSTQYRTVGDLQRGLDAGEPEALAEWTDWWRDLAPVVQRAADAAATARAEVAYLTRPLPEPELPRQSWWQRPAVAVSSATVGSVGSVVGILSAFHVL